MSYILITPVRNEEKYLPYFIRSVLSQTIIPKFWVIVNNDSQDNSSQILRGIEKEYEFVHVINQPHIPNADGHLNFSLAVNQGYEYIIKLCQSKNIKYEYVGKIDADILIPPNYFERLMEKFEQDQKLGVVSGVAYTINRKYDDYSYDSIKEEDVVQDNYLPDELPDKRLYRKECLEQIGGFPITIYSPDTVMLAKARLRGWKVKWFEDIKFYNMRKDTGTKRNMWSAYRTMGEGRYYLNYNPILLLGSILFTLNKPPYYFLSAFPILHGYLSMVIKKKRISDEEIKEYFGKKRLKELICALLSKSEGHYETEF